MAGITLRRGFALVGFAVLIGLWAIFYSLSTCMYAATFNLGFIMMTIATILGSIGLVLIMVSK